MCALEGRDETLGPDHRQTLQTVHDLGSCLLDGNKNDQAKVQLCVRILVVWTSWANTTKKL